MREQTNKRTSHAGKTNKLKCLREELQQQSNKYISHEATTNKEHLMAEKLKQSFRYTKVGSKAIEKTGNKELTINYKPTKAERKAKAMEAGKIFFELIKAIKNVMKNIGHEGTKTK